MFGPGGARGALCAGDGLQPGHSRTAVTRYCFARPGTRPGLDRKTRSLINAGDAYCANQAQSAQGACRRGRWPTACSIRGDSARPSLHTAVYAALPCGVEAFTAAGGGARAPGQQQAMNIGSLASVPWAHPWPRALRVPVIRSRYTNRSHDQTANVGDRARLAMLHPASMS